MLILLGAFYVLFGRVLIEVNQLGRFLLCALVQLILQELRIWLGLRGVDLKFLFVTPFVNIIYIVILYSVILIQQIINKFIKFNDFRFLILLISVLIVLLLLILNAHDLLLHCANCSVSSHSVYFIWICFQIALVAFLQLLFAKLQLRDTYQQCQQHCQSWIKLYQLSIYLEFVLAGCNYFTHD